MGKNRSGYIRTNRFGQEVRKRTFEFSTELLKELRETTQQLKVTDVEFVTEAVKEKLQGCKA